MSGPVRVGASAEDGRVCVELAYPDSVRVLKLTPAAALRLADKLERLADELDAPAVAARVPVPSVEWLSPWGWA
jgi:hypothetical protein